MDIADHVPHIRLVYISPWQERPLANPGKVSTRVQVGVRPQTTLFAHETMFDPLAESAAAGAGLAGVGQIDVLDPDAGCPSLVLDKRLQLPKGPAMRLAARPFPRLDAGAMWVRFSSVIREIPALTAWVTMALLVS